MRYLTAGESHGIGLCAILDGFPAGVPIDGARLNAELSRRRLGYGRGARMQIETDTAHILSGIFGGKTIGSPISFFIPNRDYEKWQPYTDPLTGKIEEKALTAVRPGHADYTGAVKYALPDARPVLERASARETAARVGVGALCKQLLGFAGITVASHIVRIGDVASERKAESAVHLNEQADRSPVRCIDGAAEKEMMRAVDAAKQAGDTLGGVAEIVISGVPAGLGSYVQYDRKLDGILAGHFLSIQAVKSVAFGLGEAAASLPGSRVHDELFPAEGGGIARKSNNAGGIEGGMSNGEDIVARIAVKPIPTLMRGLRTVDIASKECVTAAPERSDCCAVPAAGVVAENVAAFVILDELLRVTGGDDFATVLARTEELRRRTV